MDFSTGTRILAGDFNLLEGDNTFVAHWERNGFVEIQHLWARLTGWEPRPTCKQRTRKDFVYLSSELIPFVQSVEVLDDFFADHAVLIAPPCETIGACPGPGAFLRPCLGPCRLHPEIPHICRPNPAVLGMAGGWGIPPPGCMMDPLKQPVLATCLQRSCGDAPSAVPAHDFCVQVHAVLMLSMTPAQHNFVAGASQPMIKYAAVWRVQEELVSQALTSQGLAALSGAETGRARATDVSVRRGQVPPTGNLGQARSLYFG